MFLDILKVGAVSCLSPLQTVLTILIFTKILAGYGTETLAGYGMGSRLEFLLTPIAFAFGVASVPMVGMAIGAGLVTRARQVAWTAGAAAGLTVGADRPDRRGPCRRSGCRCSPAIPASPPRRYSYFAWAGPAFAFFGMGACLYFSSQGAAKVGGPVMAGTARLLMVGGRRLVAGVDRAPRPGRCSRWSAPRWCVFGLGIGAIGPADPLGQVKFASALNATLHKFDLLLCRPAFRGR